MHTDVIDGNIHCRTLAASVARKRYHSVVVVYHKFDVGQVRAVERVRVDYLVKVIADRGALFKDNRATFDYTFEWVNCRTLPFARAPKDRCGRGDLFDILFEHYSSSFFAAAGFYPVQATIFDIDLQSTRQYS